MEQSKLVKWACALFGKSCYLGDLAHEGLDRQLSEDEMFHLQMAYEGFIIGCQHKDIPAQKQYDEALK